MMSHPFGFSVPMMSTTRKSDGSRTTAMSAFSICEKVRIGVSEIRVEAVSGAPRRSGPKVGAEVTPLNPCR